jgi:hypothetical protein
VSTALATPRRVLIARLVAVGVDLLQYALLPAELTPLNNAIDVGTALAMAALVGWHWAFLPTFLAELVPFVDLAPTWTLAVMFATRGRGATGEGGSAAGTGTGGGTSAQAGAPPAAALPGSQPRDASGS